MWRRTMWGCVVGPIAFVVAWAVGGAVTTRPYSSVDDTISRLAAVGAPTQPLMTAGMIVFGVAVPSSAPALRRALPDRTWIAAAATGAATLAVAATPLDRSALVDALHVAAAGSGYVTLAAIPLLARRSLIEAGHRTLAAFGTTMAAVSVAALPISLVVTQTGLFQRIGLTAGDLFLVASVPTVREILRNRVVG